jgi:hypothetical protein
LDAHTNGTIIVSGGEPEPTNTPTNTPEPPTGLTILVDPAMTSVDAGQTFNVSVVVEAGDQEVDGASAYLNFDKDAIQVVSMTEGSSFQFELQNSFDNDAGTIDFAAGSFGSLPSGSITLVEIEFEAIAATSGSDLAFQFDAPRQTDVTSGGASVLEAHINGQVTISPVAPGSFNATAQENGVQLNWATTSEEGMAGFNLYRTTSPEWSRSFSATMLDQLNDVLIDANGEPSSYSYLDDTAEEDTTYHYWLEYVMSDGSTQMLPDPATNQPTEVTSITIGDMNADGTPGKRNALPYLAIGLLLAGAWIVRRRRR